MVDEVFGVLAHSHRRRVLRTLLESDGTDLPLSLEDLLDGEHDPEAFTLEMTHRHLAKLADEGFVEFARVFTTLIIFVLIVFSIGYLMRTAVGDLVERVIDDVMNHVPGLRVVYNASKMAVETALSGTEELQSPVKLEVWDGMRMTAFKTGKTTDDGREVLFLPTAPNITTGYVLEVEPHRYEEIDERVEDALTRILSAGFGDTNRNAGGTPIPVADEEEFADD